MQTRELPAYTKISEQSETEKIVTASFKAKPRFYLLIKNTENKEVLRLAKEKLQVEKVAYTSEEIETLLSQINNKLKIKK